MSEKETGNQPVQRSVLRRNLLLVLALLAVIAVLLAVLQRKAPVEVDPDAPKLEVAAMQLTEAPTEEPTEAPTEEVQETPETTQTPESTGNPEASENPASTDADEPEPTATVDLSTVDAFLVVTVGNTTYEPLPLTEEGYYGLRHDGCENIIHVTENSVSMYYSNCENQDCVEQGEVTLENKETRILGNMIICLPNQVSLELYSREELAEWILSTMTPVEEVAQEDGANE